MFMSTIDLPLKFAMQDVDISVIRRQPNMTQAIVLCASLAGFKNDKPLCDKLDIDPGQWARIKNNQSHFPHEKYERVMDVCSNEVPLIWLADRRGYDLMPQETELQRQLRVERDKNDEFAKENALLRNLLVGRAL